MPAIQACSQEHLMQLVDRPLVARIWMSIVRACRRWAASYADARRFRCDLATLSQYDDHQLKDIGLRRDQIESFLAAKPGNRALTGCDPDAGSARP